MPLFCEKCGYSFHGLSVTRCGECGLLHHHCPECGERQSINTLRPAFHGFLGRLRTLWLTVVLLLKFALLVYAIAGWGILGNEMSSMEWNGHGHSNNDYRQARRLEMAAVSGIVGFIIGGVLRMAFLQWKRSWIVGSVIAGLGAIVTLIGWWSNFPEHVGWTWGMQFILPFVVLPGMAATVLGACIAWPIWVGLVKLFLPSKQGRRLLEWQKSLSDPAAIELGK